MNKLEKAAEKREIEICQYSTKDCLNTNDCHRCQWGVPSLDLRCSNNASFKLGAQWKAKQSPWISVEERLPEKDGILVLVKSSCLNEQPLVYHKGRFYARLSDGAYDGSVTHWMYIPE